MDATDSAPTKEELQKFALCKQYEHTLEKYEELEAQLKLIGNDLDAIEEKLIEIFSSSQDTKFKTNFGTASLYFITSYKEPKDPEKKKMYWDYLTSRGLNLNDWLTVNSAKMNADLRKEEELAIEKGQIFETPPGLDPPFRKPKIRWTRAR